MRFSARLSVTRRLQLLVAAFLVAFAAVGLLSWRTMEQVGIRGPLYGEIVGSKDLIADILPPPAYLIESYAFVQRLPLATAPERQQLRARLDQLAADFESRHSYWAQQLPSGALKTAIVDDVYRSGRALLATIERELLPTVERGDVAGAQRLLAGAVDDAFAQHDRAVRAAVTLATAYNADREAYAASTVRTRRWLLLLLPLGAISLALLLAVALARQITLPLARTVEVLDRVAAGDLTAQVTIAHRDEIGHVGAAVNQTTQAIAATVRTLHESAQTLAAAAEELTATAHEIATQTGDTAARTEAAAAASQQVSGTAESVAAAVEQMDASIREIAASVTRAARVASDTARASREAGEVMSALGARSQEISGIITTINSIAEKTNLLALNAAIESARAGEAGKGFAVVASEVKELAKQTATATEEIGVRIESMQASADSAARALGTVATQIHEIDTISASLALSIEQQSATTAEIGRSVAVAASGTAGVTQQIAQVASATQETARSIAALSAATGELTAMATVLNDSAARFRVHESRRYDATA